MAAESLKLSLALAKRIESRITNLQQLGEEEKQK